MSESIAAPRQLLYGTRQIARHLGHEALATMIRRHPEDWPLFMIGNVVCGYADAIDAALAAKERAGLAGLKPLVRKRPMPRLDALADA
jgi:hypothetical protein